MKDDDVIQWRFGDENTLIAEINVTADRITVYDDVLDGRFRDRLKLDNQTGSLTITNITTEHDGDYKLKINSEIKRFVLNVYDEVKSVSVKEGDSVSLNSRLTEMKDDDVIQWRFGDENTLIAEIYKRFDTITVYDDVLDGRFRDRLKLDNQTGSLTITNTRAEHAGDYELLMFTDLLYSGRFSSKVFRVSVYDSVHCCGPTEAVIRLVLSALVGVATVIIVVYEIRSRRAERDQAHIHTSESGDDDDVSVREGDFEMKDDYVIQWRIENTVIAEINVTADRITVYDDVLDGRFRDRLKLDNQTGSLTITNTRAEHDGEYKLQINSERKRFRLGVYITLNSDLSNSRVFTKYPFVKEGDSVSLNSDLTEMKDDEVIQWRFGNKNTLIAEINKRADTITVYDDVLDGRFRDRLKLDNQTGSLTITNTRTEHEGDYKLETNWKIKRFRLFVFVLVSVMEGDSVSLNSDLTEIEDDDVIQWRFGDENTLIAEINKPTDRITVYDDVLDGRFRDRLKLDNQTGSLTITNTTTEHDGDYKLETNSEIKSFRRKSFRRKRFILFVIDEVKSVSVKEGDSVSLNSDLTEMKDDDVIQWRFGDENTLIAEINVTVDRITVYDDVLDGRFRDRLKLDNQTGSLTITNTRAEHNGEYKLLMITGRFSSKAFRVSVYDSVHCCGPTEAVIRLVLSALVGVATVIIVVYEIRSRRAERDQAHIHTSGSIEI
ncbi:unnamed protein product [Leuciscus chuanchicus]